MSAMDLVLSPVDQLLQQAAVLAKQLQRKRADLKGSGGQAGGKSA